MKPQLLCGCVLLCTLISSSSTATVNQSENTKGFFDFGNSEEKDKTGHTFSYEFMTPQRILTGCTGTKYPSGDVKTVYYFVDATGQKKFIFPNKAAEVVFPDDTGLPGLTRTQKVYMYEMCFPTPCNVQGSCGPAGSTVGPTGWSLPKFPWLPWGNNNGKGKDPLYTFNLNSHNSASASLSPNSAQIAIGLSGNAEANKQDKPNKPTTPVKPPVLTSINVGSGSGVSATADAESEADTQVIINTNGNGTQVIVDVGSEADAGATVGVSFTGTGNNGGWKPPTTTTTTTSRPTTTRPKTTTGWAWLPPSSTTTRPTTTTGWAWVPPPTTAKPTTTTTGWAWVPPPSTTAPPTTTSGWTWTPPPTTTTTTKPTTTSAPPTTTIPTTTTSGWTPPPTTAPTTTTSTTPVPTTTTTTAKPCTTSTTEPPTTSTTTTEATTTTTEPTTTTTTTTTPAPICNCTNIPESNSSNPGSGVSSSSSSFSSSSSSSSDCDGECKCCSKCSISSFIEKLSLAGFGNYISKGQAPPPTNQWSSGTWNSYAGPNAWPFGRSEPEHMTRDAQGRINDPEYYKGIPGAIRGDLPVIYYPSCDPNAYFQPAVINYCTDNSAWGKNS